jgi:hypothetical protein
MRGRQESETRQRSDWTIARRSGTYPQRGESRQRASVLGFLHEASRSGAFYQADGAARLRQHASLSEIVSNPSLH